LDEFFHVLFGCVLIFRVFESVVVVTFQINFRAEMYENDIFLKKKLFLKSAHQNDSKHKKINFLQKKKLNFFENTQFASQLASLPSLTLTCTMRGRFESMDFNFV